MHGGWGCSVRGERSFGWGESTGLPPGKCVPSAIVASIWRRVRSNGQDSYRGSLWAWSRRVIKTRRGCALFGKLRSFMRGGGGNNVRYEGGGARILGSDYAPAASRSACRRRL